MKRCTYSGLRTPSGSCKTHRCRSIPKHIFYFVLNCRKYFFFGQGKKKEDAKVLKENIIKGNIINCGMNEFTFYSLIIIYLLICF